VFSEAASGAWMGSMAAFNTSTPFQDSFTLIQPGGPSNYSTGVSQALGGASFVWRGYMSGVDCQYAPKCAHMCAEKEGFAGWRRGCDQRLLFFRQWTASLSCCARPYDTEKLPQCAIYMYPLLATRALSGCCATKGCQRSWFRIEWPA
jgi:hypothetical protein